MSLEEIRGYRKVGPGRFREDYGLFFEDFEIGAVVEHRPGRTVTETDAVWQSLLGLDLHPLQIDAAHAAASEHGRPVVSGLVALAIVGGLSLNSTSAKGIANLGWDKIRLHAPVFPGDTLYAESEVLAKRRSKSRPTQGIVTCETRGRKHDGTLFLTYRRSFLVPVREHARQVDPNY